MCGAITKLGNARQRLGTENREVACIADHDMQAILLARCLKAVSSMGVRKLACRAWRYITAHIGLSYFYLQIQ